MTDPIRIANSFNEYFANVGPSIENKISVSRYIYSDYLKDVYTSKSLLLPKTRCLLEIPNLSFRTGILPDLCKVEKVIPIFKKDDSLLCQNYRPIYLLPNL